MVRPQRQRLFEMKKKKIQNYIRCSLNVIDVSDTCVCSFDMQERIDEDVFCCVCVCVKIKLLKHFDMHRSLCHAFTWKNAV